MIFNNSEFLCLFNFIFYSPYLMLAIVAIAAVYYISLKLNMAFLKNDEPI